MYLATGDLPNSKQGQHVKSHSLLMDEDILDRVRFYLLQNKFKISPAEFTEHVNHQILPNAEGNKVISGKSATRWMQRLGLQYSEVRKDMFVDGHERPDVLEYRTIFLKRMADLEVQMPIFSGKEMEIETWPVGEPIILVTHDESTFAAHDGQKNLWLQDGQQPLRKEDAGRSIHVSEFFSDVGGRLLLSDLKQLEHPSVPKEAYVIMHTGKNYDGWWTCEDLFKQVRDRAIPIFEAQYPTSKALCAFDNAASHAAFATDALVRKRMNLRSGGKQPKMRNGRMKDGTVHPMCFPETHPNVTL